MTIREKVAQALSDTTGDRPEPGQLFNHLATTAINAFLAAAAEEDWHMAKDKATRPMTIAAEKMGAGEAWAEDCWAAMLAAAPKFAWDK